MLDIIDTIIIVSLMFYFYFQLDQKIEKINKSVNLENKALNQKVIGLSQLLTSYLNRH